MEREIFRKGSTTYYWSSLFFPKALRRDVFDLYSFVRVADDYVDQVPADKDGFYQLFRLWLEMTAAEEKSAGDTVNVRVVKNIRHLQAEYDFGPELVESFLGAMQADIAHKNYQTLDDTLHYTHGSAEVVGLMMAKIMNLTVRKGSGALHFDAEQGVREEHTESYRRYDEGAPQRDNTAQREKPLGKVSFADFESEVLRCARMQGRAMQWLNFIRDIEEDNQLGRQYFPVEDLKRFNLKDLSRETASNQPDDFRKFMQFQIDRYKKWQQEASAGYHYIPRRYRIPIKTAADMYLWTANQIAKDPLIVFQHKIKPSKARILRTVLANLVKS